MNDILNTCLTELQSFFNGDLMMVTSAIITISLILLGFTLISGILSSIYNNNTMSSDEDDERDGY